MTKGIIIEDLSVLIDTHDLHRRAFNQAFIECGLPWEWDNQTFDEMVHIHKSVDKIIHYNDTHGGLEIHSAEFINSVSELFFERLLARNPLKMLPGIQELLAMAKRNNYHVLLSTLEPKSLVLSALASASIPIDCFASITQKERPEFDEHYYSDFTHSQTTFNAEIDDLESTISFYEDKIAKDKETIKKLQDSLELERFAREKYLMKKENEDIYIIEFDTIKK